MDVDVLIALPTPDLADSCDRLEAALVAETHSVRRVARNDLDDLSDADLQRLFATARIVVVPVSEAKLLMQRLPGGHLKLQADALPQGEAKRALYWRPAAGRVLDEGAAEADPKHLAALTELLRRAGPAASVDDVAEEIGRPTAPRSSSSSRRTTTLRTAPRTTSSTTCRRSGRRSRRCPASSASSSGSISRR
jgi:hypothetical protein